MSINVILVYSAFELFHHIWTFVFIYGNAITCWITKYAGRALVAYTCSFIVVFFCWSRFTLLLDYTEILGDVTIFISLIFLVTVTLTPVALIGLLELGNEHSLIFFCVVQILAGILHHSGKYYQNTQDIGS